MADDATRVTLIGGPTLLLELEGFRLLTDPTFDPPGSYASAYVTLTKRTGPALSPEALGPIDAVLLSHDQHADNLDHAGRELLGAAPRVLTTPEGAGRAPNAEGLVLFTGRAQPRGPFGLTMDTNDALEAAAAFPGARVIAIHNEGWAHFTQSEDDLRRAFEALGVAERLVPLERGHPHALP